MKKLILKCPSCEEELMIIFDKDMNIKSICLNNIEVSESEQKELLNKHGIEFG